MDKRESLGKFHFREDQEVVLRNDYPELGLHAGDRGVIFCYYELDEPAYEVTIRNEAGEEFGMVLSEHEIALPSRARSAERLVQKAASVAAREG